MATILSLTKAREKVASMQRSSAMGRVKARGDQVVHTVIAAGASYAMGTIERTTTNPLPTLFGLDPKLTWGGFFAVVGTAMSGRMGSGANAISDGLLSSYGYAQGLGKGYTLQGEHDGGDDIDI